jgi:hypothetical protein
MALGPLRPEMHDIAALLGRERLARLSSSRWIGHTRASQALALLHRMVLSESDRFAPATC